MFKKGRVTNRSNEQVKLLGELEELWLQMPSLRFMQFVEVVTGCKGQQGGNCNFYMTDEEFLTKLRKMENTQFTDNYYEKNSTVH